MENPGIFETIAIAFSQGGIWMWAIFVAQIFSIAIIVERVLKLYLTRKTDQARLVMLFESDMKSGELEDIIDKANAMPSEPPIARVVKAGAQAALDMGGRDEIQARMDEVLLSESSRIQKRTGLLAMLGNAGTLLGLLGTIIGLIKAFAAVADKDPVEKAAMLTNGIAMAMNTTAYGLIMAIPALVMFGILQSRTNSLSEDLNQAALKAYNLLSFKNEAATRRTPRVRTKKS